MTHNGAPHGNTHGLKWLPPHDAALKRYFDRGYSFSQAAVKINDECGTRYTRNSCISRAGRIGLVSALTKTRQPMISRKSEGQRNRIRLVAPKPPRAALSCEEIMPRYLTLVDLERDDCRYPFGEGPFTFCALPQLDGCSYCPSHAILCGKSPC